MVNIELLIKQYTKYENILNVLIYIQLSIFILSVIGLFINIPVFGYGIVLATSILLLILAMIIGSKMNKLYLKIRSDINEKSKSISEMLEKQIEYIENNQDDDDTIK